MPPAYVPDHVYAEVQALCYTPVSPGEACLDLVKMPGRLPASRMARRRSRTPVWKATRAQEAGAERCGSGVLQRDDTMRGRYRDNRLEPVTRVDESPDGRCK